MSEGKQAMTKTPKTGTCEGCGGKIRLYETTKNGDVVTAFAHLSKDDWTGTPHPATPNAATWKALAKAREKASES